MSGDGVKPGRSMVLYDASEIDLVEAIRGAEGEMGAVDMKGMEREEQGAKGGGKVGAAFSRKRGFRKKIKKRG